MSVVLADERPAVRRAVAAALSAAPGIAVVAEAATAREAVGTAARHRPTVLVLAADLPGGRVDGTVRDVLRAAPGTAVLVFTAAEDMDEDALVAAVRAGARGHLHKNSPDGAIVRAVTAIARGETILGPGVVQRLIHRVGARAARFRDMFPQLTTREQDVLELVVAGLGNAAIAARLNLSPKTVGNRVSVIFGKLRVTSRAAAIDLVRSGQRAHLDLVTGPGEPRTFRFPTRGALRYAATP